MPTSRYDSTVHVSESEWAVTLLSKDGMHGVLIFEGEEVDPSKRFSLGENPVWRWGCDFVPAEHTSDCDGSWTAKCTTDIAGTPGKVRTTDPIPVNRSESAGTAYVLSPESLTPGTATSMRTWLLPREQAQKVMWRVNHFESQPPKYTRYATKEAVGNPEDASHCWFNSVSWAHSMLCELGITLRSADMDGLFPRWRSEYYAVNQNAMLRACAAGNVPFIRGMLNYPHVTINGKGKLFRDAMEFVGRTPLMVTAMWAQPEAARFLVSRGAKLTIRSGIGGDGGNLFSFRRTARDWAGSYYQERYTADEQTEAYKTVYAFLTAQSTGQSETEVMESLDRPGSDKSFTADIKPLGRVILNLKYIAKGTLEGQLTVGGQTFAINQENLPGLDASALTSASVFERYIQKIRVNIQLVGKENLQISLHDDGASAVTLILGGIVMVAGIAICCSNPSAIPFVAGSVMSSAGLTAVTMSAMHWGDTNYTLWGEVFWNEIYKTSMTTLASSVAGLGVRQLGILAHLGKATRTFGHANSLSSMITDFERLSQVAIRQAAGKLALQAGWGIASSATSSAVGFLVKKYLIERQGRLADLPTMLMDFVQGLTPGLLGTSISATIPPSAAGVISSGVAGALSSSAIRLVRNLSILRNAIFSGSDTGTLEARVAQIVSNIRNLAGRICGGLAEDALIGAAMGFVSGGIAKTFSPKPTLQEKRALALYEVAQGIESGQINVEALEESLQSSALLKALGHVPAGDADPEEISKEAAKELEERHKGTEGPAVVFASLGPERTPADVRASHDIRDVILSSYGGDEVINWFLRNGFKYDVLENAADCCVAVYEALGKEIPDAANLQRLSVEYRRFDVGFGKDDSFKMVPYVDETDKILYFAIRGTDGLEQWLSNLSDLGPKGKPYWCTAEQEQFIADIARHYPDFKILVCGHSYGAAAAQAIAGRADLPSVGFDTPPIDPKHIPAERHSDGYDHNHLNVWCVSNLVNQQTGPLRIAADALGRVFGISLQIKPQGVLGYQMHNTPEAYGHSMVNIRQILREHNKSFTHPTEKTPFPHVKPDENGRVKMTLCSTPPLSGKVDVTPA